MNLQGIRGHSRQLDYLSALRKRKEIPHAFLFSGPPGIGKKLIGRRFLNSLFCSSTPSPCMNCRICSQFEAGSFSDFILMEGDEKGKIPVGDRDRPVPGTVRWLIDRLNKSSVSGRYGILIDGVDTISEAGQNALLKTIEEPPPGTCIIMTARSRSTVLRTIVSRSMDITFNPLEKKSVYEILSESGCDPHQAELVSSISGGSVENALVLTEDGALDSVFSFCEEIKRSLPGNNSESFFSDLKSGQDSEFLLTHAVNIYSFMLSEQSGGAGSILPETLLVRDREVLRKIIKILLAIQKGMGNNLNVKNSLKGMFYSFGEIDASGFPEPDFSWID